MTPPSSAKAAAIDPAPITGDDSAASGSDAKAKAAAAKHGAKPVKPKPGGDKKDATPTAAPPPDKNVLPPPKGGDKIYLKGGPGDKGTVLTGVQVLRSTSSNYEVELVPGEPPLLIPRKQVERIEYDDIDPVRDRLREQMFPKAQEVTIASGERVTGALRDKLEAPVSPEKMSYKDQDFVRVLDDVKTKTGTNLKVDPSVEGMQASQRRWTVEIPPDKKLMTLLRTDLVGAFNFVEVVFETDGIIVMTKEAAKKRADAIAAAEKAAESKPGAAQGPGKADAKPAGTPGANPAPKAETKPAAPGAAAPNAAAPAKP